MLENNFMFADTQTMYYVCWYTEYVSSDQQQILMSVVSCNVRLQRESTWSCTL